MTAKQRTLAFEPIEVGGVRYVPQKRAPEGRLTPLPNGHTKHAATGLMIDQYGCEAYRPRPVLRVYAPDTGEFCWYVPAALAAPYPPGGG